MCVSEAEAAHLSPCCHPDGFDSPSRRRTRCGCGGRGCAASSVPPEGLFGLHCEPRANVWIPHVVPSGKRFDHTTSLVSLHVHPHGSRLVHGHRHNTQLSSTGIVART